MGGMAVLQNNNTDSAATVTATFNTATNTYVTFQLTHLPRTSLATHPTIGYFIAIFCP